MAEVERRLTTSISDEGDAGEEAFGKAAEELRKKRDQEDMERMAQEAQDRQRELEKEQEDLAKYKERKAQREKEKEEEDLRKAAQEQERQMREEEEKRKRKEAMEKKKADKIQQQQQQGQKEGSSQDKMSLIRHNIEKAKDEAGKSESQLQDEKDAAVAERVAPLDFGGLGVDGLIHKAKEIHELIRQCEGEKYDLEIRIKKQAYEVKELNTRISEQQRRSAKPAIRIRGFAKMKDMGGEGHRRKTDEPSLQASGGVKGRANMFSQQKPDDKGPIERKTTGNATAKFGGGVVEKCENCKKAVYPGEKIEARGLTFHRPCFRCCECHKTLNSNTFGYLEKFLCKNHYRKAMSAKERAAELLAEQAAAEAAGQPAPAPAHAAPVHNDVGEPEEED